MMDILILRAAVKKISKNYYQVLKSTKLRTANPNPRILTLIRVYLVVKTTFLPLFFGVVIRVSVQTYVFDREKDTLTHRMSRRERDIEEREEDQKDGLCQLN
jgi:hypothetical protein